jgi:type IV secretion system protein VirD4
MKKTTEDVEQLAMGDFDEEFEQLAFMNGIDPKGYELVREKIDSTLIQLQDEMEKQEA